MSTMSFDVLILMKTYRCELELNYVIRKWSAAIFDSFIGSTSLVVRFVRSALPIDLKLVAVTNVPGFLVIYLRARW